MKVYPVPLLLVEEEKVVGGRLSLRQVAYLFAGVAAGACVYWMLRPLGQGAALFLAALPVAAGAAMALVQLPRLGMGLDRFLALWLRFRLAPKEFPYRRSGMSG